MERQTCSRATLIVLMLQFAAGIAGAQTLSVTAPATLSYSPDSVVQSSGSVNVRRGTFVGPFCIVLTQLSLTPAPAEGLSYGLYKPAASPTYALSLDGSPASANEVLSGSFASTDARTKTLTLDFAALVSPATLPPPGTYTAKIKADMYRSAFPPSGAVLRTKNFNVRVLVGSFYDVSVVPVDSSFALASTSQSLAFGTLAAGDSRGADILVRSNVAYSLSLSSAKGGALAHTVDGSLVAYALTANGTSLTLPAGIPASVASGAAATYSAPARYRIAVTILPFAILPPEGDYSDSLTVTLAAP